MNEVTVTTTPTLLVSVQEAADYLHLDSNEPELDNLLRGVQEKAEAYVGKSFTERTIELRLDEVPYEGVVSLPRFPVTSITSVETIDESDAKTTIGTSTYYMADNERLVFTTIPDVSRDYGGLLITYVSGAATSTPGAMKVGILKSLATIFEHREDFVVGSSVAKLPDSGKTYLDTWRSLC